MLILIGVAFVIPPVREKINQKWDDISTRIFFLISPPEKTVFVPGQQIDNIVKLTLTAIKPTQTNTPVSSPTAGTTITPTATLAPIPPTFILDKVPYVDQHGLWNYCAPSNLAMQLNFWGWPGKRTDIGAVVKPNELDKNVMPYELADFVNDKTDFKAIVRYGGNVDLLKRVIASGFPVLIEKGVYFPEVATGKTSWMGHYNIILGYDDSTGEVITHDSYEPDGKFKHFKYDVIIQQWRAFDFVFLVVYPQDQWDKLAAVLGKYQDENASYAEAQTMANEDIGSTTGIDHFYALFNRGTNLVKQQDYSGAATTYDEAYNFYTTLSEATRPYRMTWYQTGPYYAYYYAGRYQDVINLTTTTLKSTPQPMLEENYYWRAMAEIKLGKHDDAVQDICESLKDHPDFPPSVSLSKDLGGVICK
jgi:tetratricopeptide (TPR) repeat protein